MLEKLIINNIALIDSLELEFDSGLNIFSGETGAGKSIIIDSIYALLGERTPKDLFRTGKEKAYVEALFRVDPTYFDDLSEMSGAEIEPDGSLIISREITAAGRNNCRINGRMATVTALKEIGSRLIDIHGQHDNQSLLIPENHIRMLDSFAGGSHQNELSVYRKIHSEYKINRKNMADLDKQVSERERRSEFLKYQIDEIEKAKLKDGEEEELGRQKALYGNAEKIKTALAEAYAMIGNSDAEYKSASDLVSECFTTLSSIARFDDKFQDFSKRAEEAVFSISELASDIRGSIDEIEYEPALIDEIESRLDLIYRLKRKYGASDIRNLLQIYAGMQEESETLENSSVRMDELKALDARMTATLLEESAKIRSGREIAASILEERICEQLDSLEMKNTRFSVKINSTGGEKFLDNGMDEVEFLISPNPGEPLKPLIRIASGGEMSRIMLAIKIIIADIDKIPTMIFDEIDNGIGGRVSIRVAENLAILSDSHQVICVTHIAQIASSADRNFLIEKHTTNGMTSTEVAVLESELLQSEIARLLSGNSSSRISLDLAREMLESGTRRRNDGSK